MEVIVFEGLKKGSRADTSISIVKHFQITFANNLSNNKTYPVPGAETADAQRRDPLLKPFFR